MLVLQLTHGASLSLRYVTHSFRAIANIEKMALRVYLYLTPGCSPEVHIACERKDASQGPALN